MHGLLTTRRRAGLVAALGAAAVVAAAGLAYADDIVNTLDATVDSTAEVMSLNVGGAAGSTQLYVVERNGDGKQGCNLTGSTILTVAAASSDPTVAAVTSDGLTFTSCQSRVGLTVTPLKVGAATITLSQVKNTTAGTFELRTATFTVVVAPPPNTAPDVSITGVTPGGDYAKGSVPQAMCSVADTEDGPSTFPATLTGPTGPYASDGLGRVEATCSYTDAGGLSDSDSLFYTVSDLTAPTISYALTPSSPDGADGWYRASVTLDWTVADADSPNSLTLTGCADRAVTQDQLPTTYTCSATSAGGSAGPVSVTVKRDATAPELGVGVVPAAPDGDNGWYRTQPTASFPCSDATSGVASCPADVAVGDGAAQTFPASVADRAGNSASVTSPALSVDTVAPSVSGPALTGTAGDAGWYRSDVTATWSASDLTSGLVGGAVRSVPSVGEGALTIAAPTFTDVAGNASTGTGAEVRVDKAGPSVVLAGGPQDGASYYFRSVPSAPTCTASDDVSGLAGACTVTGYGAGLGAHVVTAVARDVAGNTTTVARTYSVLAWTPKGFYQPVDMNGVWNTVKAGSTVPLKFEVFAGTELTDVAAVDRFTVTRTTCPSGSFVEDAIETFDTTGSTTLRYDLTGGQFVQNWATPKAGAGSCYRVAVTTDDGSSLTASFKLK